MAANLTIDNPISCFLGNDGVISTVASGGSGTYASYLLLQTNTTDPNNDGVFENLTAGTTTEVEKIYKLKKEKGVGEKAAF